MLQRKTQADGVHTHHPSTRKHSRPHVTSPPLHPPTSGPHGNPYPRRGAVKKQIIKDWIGGGGGNGDDGNGGGGDAGGGSAPAGNYGAA